MTTPPKAHPPTAIAFTANELRTIKTHPLADRILPPTTANSEHARQSANFRGSYDHFYLSHIGLDGLPVIYKTGSEYQVVSGHFSLAAARQYDLPLVCNVYPKSLIGNISNTLLVRNLIGMPLFWRQTELAHLRFPLGCAATKGLRPISYVLAALLEAFCRTDSTVRCAVPSRYFDSYRNLSSLGIGSYGGLAGIVKSFGMMRRTDEELRRLGQAVHPDLFK